MKRFPSAYATHPQWAMAVQLVLAQLRAQMALPDHAHTPPLGLLYITDHYASHAGRILERLATELPGVSDWAGATGIGVCGAGAAYVDTPALSVMLCDLPRDQYRVWSGIAPLPASIRFRPGMALVHADGDTLDLPELIGELAERTENSYLFGGLVTSRAEYAPQFAWSGSAQGGHRRGGEAHNDAAGANDAAEASEDGADNGSDVPGVFFGGLSGVAFGRGVLIASRVTQGCQPVAPERRVTAVERNVLLALDQQPALDVLIDDLGLDIDHPHHALDMLRQTFAGLAESDEDGVRRTGDFGPGVRVQRLIGVDLGRRGIVLANEARLGQRIAFCQPNAQAARADLVRICAEIREALESRTAYPSGNADTEADLAAPPFASGARIVGAHYVSCVSRSDAYFDAPGAELQIIRQALGDVPLTGFFANGEIAYRYLYGYTGILTVFAQEAEG